MLVLTSLGIAIELTGSNDRSIEFIGRRHERIGFFGYFRGEIALVAIGGPHLAEMIDHDDVKPLALFVEYIGIAQGTDMDLWHGQAALIVDLERISPKGLDCHL